MVQFSTQKTGDQRNLVNIDASWATWRSIYGDTQNAAGELKVVQFKV
jgi:hypothetical protein